jgi:hypothetical protein
MAAWSGAASKPAVMARQAVRAFAFFAPSRLLAFVDIGLVQCPEIARTMPPKSNPAKKQMF